MLLTWLQQTPGWVLPGASLDLNFAAGTYYPAGVGSLITTSRAQTVSSYALNSAGLWIAFAANVPRITDLGLLIEEARTNVVLWNRDLTNAAWTKSNITTALDQTGADGTANAATSLTATAGNGTCLQAITLASSPRSQSVVVKRITGTGTINMTMDNGSTWTAIAVTSSYTQLTIPTQTLANPTVGFRIVTSGDAIAVDFVQNANGTFPTSPIPTTTVAVARAADIITLVTGSRAETAALAAKAAFFQTSGIVGTTGNNRLVEFNGDQSNFSSSTAVQISNGTNSASATIGGAATYASTIKTALGFDATSITIVSNGGTPATSANAWAAPTSPVYLGNRSDAIRALNGYMRRASFGPSKGQFDGLTA